MTSEISQWLTAELAAARTELIQALGGIPFAKFNEEPQIYLWQTVLSADDEPEMRR